MEVKRRVIDGKRVVLVLADVPEYSILAEAVREFRSTLDIILRDNPNHFSDPAFAIALHMLATKMEKEMEDPNEQGSTRR